MAKREPDLATATLSYGRAAFWYTRCTSGRPVKQAAAEDHLSDFSEDLTASVAQALAALEREIGDAGAAPVGTPGTV